MLEPVHIILLFDRLHALAPDENAAPEAKVAADPFRSLVSVMLSAQSRDEMTARATAKLFAEASTPAEILQLPEVELRLLIKDAGLYNAKARNLRAMCQALIKEHGGIVPDTRVALMTLPGVGRKSADIMLRFVFGQPAVPVDTHVFRVSTRLGLAAGSTEAQLAARLEPRVPEQWRWGAHMWLLELGKRICKPRRPRCSICPASDLCERIGVTDTASL